MGGGNLSPNQVTATSLIINRLMRKLFLRQITVTSEYLWSDRDRDLTFATKRSQITAHFKSDLDLDQITKM